MIRRILTKLSQSLPDRRAIRIACSLCLISLAATVWAVFDPRPLVVIVAMSLGQALGICGVMFYAFVVIRDLVPRLQRSKVAQAEAPKAGAGKEL